MQTVRKNIVTIFILAALMFMGTSIFPVNVQAEEILGEGEYVIPSENPLDAPYIKFDTLYYVKQKGYVAIKPETDCFVYIAYGNKILYI